MQNQKEILKISLGSVNTNPPSCSHLTTIIYNQYQLPLICDYLSYPLELQDTHMLIADPLSPSKYHIIIRICDIPTQPEEKSIEKLVALSDRLLCVELQQELESQIEKMFVSNMPEIYGRYQFAGGIVGSPQLCFVNQVHKKMYSREAEGISYFKTIKQFTQQLQSHRKNRQSPSIPVSQLLSLYNHPSLRLKQLAQIKYSMLSFNELVLIKNHKQETQKYILKEGINDVNKSVLRDISKNILGKQDIAQLQWKYSCLKNFCDLIYEEKINKGLVKKYKKSTLIELSQEELILQIKQFSQDWLTNTLSNLHKLFKSIVNRRDIKAITQFRNQYTKIYEKLNYCLLHCSNATENYKKIVEVLKDVQEYVGVCEDVIRDQYLGAFKYAKYMIKYVWKHQPKIYYKAMFFILLVVLASNMGSLVAGGLMVAGGLIFLAINI